MNTIDEGSIIKMVNSCERVLTQLMTASRLLGDASLATKCAEASVLIKRDIVFTPSLYLE